MCATGRGLRRLPGFASRSADQGFALLVVKSARRIHPGWAVHRSFNSSDDSAIRAPALPDGGQAIAPKEVPLRGDTVRNHGDRESAADGGSRCGANASFGHDSEDHETADVGDREGRQKIPVREGIGLLLGEFQATDRHAHPGIQCRARRTLDGGSPPEKIPNPIHPGKLISHRDHPPADVLGVADQPVGHVDDPIGVLGRDRQSSACLEEVSLQVKEQKHCDIHRCQDIGCLAPDFNPQAEAYLCPCACRDQGFASTPCSGEVPEWSKGTVC